MLRNSCFYGCSDKEGLVHLFFFFSVNTARATRALLCLYMLVSSACQRHLVQNVLVWRPLSGRDTQIHSHTHTDTRKEYWAAATWIRRIKCLAACYKATIMPLLFHSLIGHDESFLLWLDLIPTYTYSICWTCCCSLCPELSSPLFQEACRPPELGSRHTPTLHNLQWRGQDWRQQDWGVPRGCPVPTKVCTFSPLCQQFHTIELLKHITPYILRKEVVKNVW